jgi:hypothetical protein
LLSAIALGHDPKEKLWLSARKQTSLQVSRTEKVTLLSEKRIMVLVKDITACQTSPARRLDLQLINEVKAKLKITEFSFVQLNKVSEKFLNYLY